jgi:hypothetical protein
MLSCKIRASELHHYWVPGPRSGRARKNWFAKPSWLGRSVRWSALLCTPRYTPGCGAGCRCPQGGHNKARSRVDLRGVHLSRRLELSADPFLAKRYAVGQRMNCLRIYAATAKAASCATFVLANAWRNSKYWCFVTRTQICVAVIFYCGVWRLAFTSRVTFKNISNESRFGTAADNVLLLPI